MSNHLVSYFIQSDNGCIKIPCTESLQLLPADGASHSQSKMEMHRAAFHAHMLTGDTLTVLISLLFAAAST